MEKQVRIDLAPNLKIAARAGGQDGLPDVIRLRRRTAFTTYSAMAIDKYKELAAAREKVRELETAIASERNQQLAALPAKFGFESPEAFIVAFRAASGKRRGRKPGVAKAAGKPGAKRKRATITDSTRAEVKKLVESGKSGAEIAKAVGISLPSVQNIKKALGLVRKG